MADNITVKDASNTTQTIDAKDQTTYYTPRHIVSGEDAENAAISANPVPVGGRYDATPRTLGDGDAGSIALAADGAVHIDDGGNAITVDGTVTETNSTAILADTANIDTNVGTIAGAVTGTEMQVDIVTSALPTGAATAANQLADGHNVTVDNAAGASAVNIQDGGNSITVDGTVTETNSTAILADTASMDTNLGTIAGAVSGSEMQVDVVTSDGIAAEGAALGNGILVQGDDGTDRTNVLVDTDGHLQVDVLSGGGSGTEYTEDAAAAANPVGGVNILVRQDTPASEVTTNGDNVAQRATAYGAAYTQILDSSGNFIDSFGGSGGTSSADDADFVAGTTLGTIAQGVYESSPTSVTDGDVGAVGIDVNRNLKVSIEADSVGIGGGTQYTEDVATANPQVGTATMMERDDALSTVTPIEGDWIGLRGSAEGALWTQDFNSDASLAALQLIDDTVAVLGTATYSEATTKGNVVGAVRNDTLATLADTDNEIAPLQVDGNGALYTHNNNLISTNNSTTTPLGDGATWTATADDVSQYTAIVFTLDASHDSSADGMTAQFSTDNSNWDDVYAWTYTAADGARRFQFPVTAQYFRLVYTNSSGAAQTHFRVQTILHAQNVQTSIHKLSSDVGPNRSATMVKSALFAQAAGAGDFTAIDATAAGNLKVSISEISDGVDIGAGNAGSETARVSISTDDVNLSAIKTATEIIDNTVVTHGAAASSATNQLSLEGRTTSQTAVDDGDAVRALATSLGKQVTQPYAIPADTWAYASTAAVTDTADDAAKAAGGAGIRNYITGVQVFNGHDTVGTEVVIKDGSTVLWRGWAEQTGGGCSARFDPPLRGTANTAVNVANITTGSSTYFNLQGFISAE